MLRPLEFTWQLSDEEQWKTVKNPNLVDFFLAELFPHKGKD